MSAGTHAFTISERELNNVHGVLLDLDNTLYNYATCHTAALKSSYAVVRKVTDLRFKEFEERYAVARKNIKRQIDGQAASHSRLLFFQNMFETYFGITRAELTLAAESAYWDGFFKKMRLYPGVRDFLTQCRKRSISVCLVTDLTAEVQLRKITHLRIANLIDLVVSSEEAGADKPHKDIFILALTKLGLAPNEVILIGDDHQKDILGARALGIRAILA